MRSAVSLAVVLVLRDLAAEEDLLFLLAERERPIASLMPHSQTICARDRWPLEIVAGAGRDAPERDLFGDASCRAGWRSDLRGIRAL
jgi:hypothetical protein